MRTYLPGEDLLAPGALQNPVPVLAWFERDHAHDVTLRNLLQRKGSARRCRRCWGLEESEAARARIEACAELPVLERWLARAVVEKSAASALE